MLLAVSLIDRAYTAPRPQEKTTGQTSVPTSKTPLLLPKYSVKYTRNLEKKTQKTRTSAIRITTDQNSIVKHT